MKLKTVSFATVLALGSSAYGVELENIKVSGQATFYYQTMENNGMAPWYKIGGKTDAQIDDDKGLFHKDSSTANVGLGIKFESDLGNGFGFGARLNVLETLGVEHNLVSGTMQGVKGVADNDSVTIRTSLTPNGTVNLKDAGLINDDEWYWAEAYLTKKIGNTVIKAGRQELNTPLLYSEKWNVMPTTFDAVAVINSDVENLTLVGAYVGKSNTHGSLGQFNTPVGGLANDGAYAIAGIYGNDSVTASGWFYNVPTAANAIWLDAKFKAAGANFLLQFADIMPDEDGLRKHLSAPKIETDDTIAFAGQGSYKFGGTTVCLALSQSNGDKDKAMLNVANFGTFAGTKGGIKTKLATATISGDGDEAGATDTTAYKLKVVQNLGEYGKGIFQFAQYIHGEDSNAAYADETATVFEAIYKQKVGGVDILGAYIYDKNIAGWTVSKSDDEESEAAQTLRLVLRYNF